MFDNSNLLFFPGQFLSGRVIIEVDDDMPVMGKSILLTIQECLEQIYGHYLTIIYPSECVFGFVQMLNGFQKNHDVEWNFMKSHF